MKIFYSIFFVLLGFLSQSECILEGGRLEPRDLKKYKYLVSIISDNSEAGKKFTCGGGILNDRMIISAAHCFADWRQNHIDEHNSIKVIAHTLTSESVSISQGSVVRYVEKIYVPKEFFGKGFADIAILKLRKSLNFLINFRKLSKLTLPDTLPAGTLPEITPGSLPASTSWDNLPYLNENAVVAGYGAHKSSWDSGKQDYVYASDNALRAMDVRVGPKPSTDRDPNTDRRFVMAEPYGNQLAKGICNGDSGSPLVMKRKNYLGLSIDDVVIGVASTNHKSCDDTTRPGQYTRVTTYLADFINPVLADPDFVGYPEVEVSYVGTDAC